MVNSQCGIEFLQIFPTCLQKFANPKCYLILYSLLGMLWHVLTSYFTGTLTTVQKNFQMTSRDLALVSTFAEFGGMISNLFLAYYVSKKHPIRSVSFGVYLIGATCFVKVLPHYFSDMGSEVKRYTQEYNDKVHLAVEREEFFYANESDADQGKFSCDYDQNGDALIFYLFVASHFFMGIGNTLYWTSGMVYMDDNCSKKTFPLLFSISYAIRFFGQSIGFFLSSLTLRVFLYPNLTPTIGTHDPRWIGAWWLGWYILGALYVFLGFFYSLFPRQLPTVAVKEAEEGIAESVMSVRDYFTTLKRIMTNRVILFETISSIFFSLGLSAYAGTFFPKYIESQFQFSPANSVLILGCIGIISKITGLLFNGIVISILQPSSRYLIGFNIVAEIVSVLGHLSYVFFGCSSAHIEGHWNDDYSWNITEECNSMNGVCDEHMKYSPVCDQINRKQYYSACHAGCTTTLILNDKKEFSDCNCLPDKGSVSDGLCSTDCAANIVIFIIILILMKFLRGAIRTIKPLIKLRSVNKEDKTMTIGISQAILQTMGLMPAPIIYGMIMDSTCIMWEKDCNSSCGQCLFYDQNRLRNIMNYTATSFLAMGILTDCFVWYNANSVKLFDDDEDWARKLKEDPKAHNGYDSKTHK